MIIQGTVQGGKRKGRHKKRWQCSITVWTGLKLGEGLRKADTEKVEGARSSLEFQWSMGIRKKE